MNQSLTDLPRTFLISFQSVCSPQLARHRHKGLSTTNQTSRLIVAIISQSPFSKRKKKNKIYKKSSKKGKKREKSWTIWLPWYSWFKSRRLLRSFFKWDWKGKLGDLETFEIGRKRVKHASSMVGVVIIGHHHPARYTVKVKRAIHNSQHPPLSSGSRFIQVPARYPLSSLLWLLLHRWLFVSDSILQSFHSTSHPSNCQLKNCEKRYWNFNCSSRWVVR